LRAERKARNLSQADIERRTGFPRCRISWLENGRAIPTIETLEKISDALEIPVYRLLYDVGESTHTATGSARTAMNGNGKWSRKNQVRLLTELRELLSRMREEDQQLLLFIALKMAMRVPSSSGAGVPEVGRGLGRTASSGTEVGNS